MAVSTAQSLAAMLIYPVFALSGFVLLRWFFNAQVERPEALQSNSRDNVLTGDLIAYIERVRADAHIPGLTVGIVRSDGYTESHAWGVKDEEGTEMSVEVCGMPTAQTKLLITVLDSVYHGIMLKGIRRCFVGYPNGRLRPRKEQDFTACFFSKSV